MAAAPLRSLLDPPVRADLHRRPQWRPLVHAAVVLGVYVALVALIATAPPIWLQVAASLILGIIFVGWFSAIHECVHGLFIDNKRWNHVAGVFWSCPTFLNFSLYRHYHLEHHRNTTVEGDPEPRGEYETLRQYLLGLTTIWFPIGFIRMSFLAAQGRFPAYVRRSEHKRLITRDNYALAAWAVVAVALTVWAPVTVTFGYWIPLAIYFPMLSITGLPEHYGCDPGGDVTTNTRSTASNALFRYIYWNNNYHAEHHAFPQVPYCNLPRLNSIIGWRFKHRSRSFTDFHLKLAASLAGGIERKARNEGGTSQAISVPRQAFTPRR